MAGVFEYRYARSREGLENSKVHVNPLHAWPTLVSLFSFNGLSIELSFKLLHRRTVTSKELCTYDESRCLYCKDRTRIDPLYFH